MGSVQPDLIRLKLGHKPVGGGLKQGIVEYFHSASIVNNGREPKPFYAPTFSSCASSASNSRRLGLISRGLPQ